METFGLEIIIQLCRIQVQRDLERLQREREGSEMTAKMRGALESLRKLQHHADYEAEKLVKRIETEARPKLEEGFRAAHSSVDSIGSGVNDIIEFAEELKNSNGGELGNSGGGSDDPPRSSEVASR